MNDPMINRAEQEFQAKQKQQWIEEVKIEWQFLTHGCTWSHGVELCATKHVEALEQKEKESDDFLTAYRTLSILEKDNLKAELAALRAELETANTRLGLSPVSIVEIIDERDNLRAQLAKLVEAAELVLTNAKGMTRINLRTVVDESQALLTPPAAVVEPQEENAIEKRWREKLAEIEHPGSTMKFKTTAADSGKGAA